MNESFDIKRFNALFLRYWTEQKKVLLLTSLLFALATLAFLMFRQSGLSNIFERSFWDFLAAVVFFLFMLFQLNLVFLELINKKKSAQFLLIPASNLEKFSFLFVFGLLIPVTLYFVTVLLFKYKILVFNASQSPDYFWDMSNIWFAVRTIYFVPFIYLLWFSGFLIFKKFHVLFTSISFAIFMFILMFVENLITKIYTNDAYLFSAAPYYHVNVSVYASHLQIDNGLMVDYFGWISVFVMIIGIIAFAANFYKFKEKEL